MTIPTGITPITVTATYVDAKGNAPLGHVAFTPSVVTVAGSVIQTPCPVSVRLVDGALVVILAATDDPQWAPTGFVYHVTEDVAGTSRTYDIELPYDAAGGAVDLATLAPVVDPDEVTPYLLATGGTITGALRVNGALTVVAGVMFGAAGDANLYRAAASVLQTDGKLALGLDVECTESSRGLVLHDRSNGNVYRLRMVNGVLGVEQV